MFSAIQILGCLNQAFLQNKLMKQLHFLHVDTNSQKLMKIFWWGMFKNECGQYGPWNIKLTASQERSDGNDFLHAGTIPHKLKDD